MNLKQWAKANGVHPMTAYGWFKAGTLPVRAERVGPRLIMVFPDEEVAAKGPNSGGVALYARVSSADQKDDLERQMGRLALWAASNGVAVSKMVSEVGSGMYVDNMETVSFWASIDAPARVLPGNPDHEAVICFPCAEHLLATNPWIRELIDEDMGVI